MIEIKKRRKKYLAVDIQLNTWFTSCLLYHLQGSPALFYFYFYFFADTCFTFPWDVYVFSKIVATKDNLKLLILLIFSCSFISTNNIKGDLPSKFSMLTNMTLYVLVSKILFSGKILTNWTTSYQKYQELLSLLDYYILFSKLHRVEKVKMVEYILCLCNTKRLVPVHIVFP